MKYILNKQQTTLIEDHLYLVKNILYPLLKNESVQGLGHDDLYQAGCEALCHAAIEYNPERGASFATFATIVIRNKLCNEYHRIRRLQSSLVYLNSPVSRTDDLTYGDTLPAKDPEPGRQTELQGLKLLESAKQDYAGVTRKGIGALQLYFIGYSQTEVADRYGTARNHVTAWISRARKQLRKDARFSDLLAS